jgi:Sulfotransferase domain
MNKRIKKIVRKITIKTILKLKLFKVENSLIIFSEKRGGSTWLFEILNTVEKVTPNWEPLNGIGSVPKKYNLGEKPYLPKNSISIEIRNVFKKVLTLKLNSDYTTNFIKAKKLISANYVLTKFVGANMICEWILYNFDFKFKPIFLIRNPIDCCSSQLNTFSKWITDDNQLKLNNSLNPERFEKNKAFLESLNTKLERQIAIWCLNNVSAINSKLINEKCIIVYYEKLLLNTESEIQRILNEIKLPQKDTINVISYNFKKASYSNFKKTLESNKSIQLGKNYKSISIDEKNKIQDIFNYFKFKLYNAYSPLPNNNYTQHRI